MSTKRVLLTNLTLAGHTGTETAVRDLALGLRRHGHHPMVWSPKLGGVSWELVESGIRVVDRLDVALPEPDVIHGHHHDETLAALARFPERPGLFVIHDVNAWHDEPPLHPRLLRHLAVSELSRERAISAGVPEDRTAVLRNAVDLDRFRPRDPLPSRPRRALVLSHTATEDSYLPDIRRACARSGIALDVVGSGVGNATRTPESLLPAYDVVFAKGRAALEAMAVGCAVIVVDRPGLAGLVTSTQLPEWLRWNLGLFVLRRPIEADAICAELDAYDADDAAKSSALVRSTCGLDLMIDAAIEHYDAVLSEWDDGPRSDLVTEMQALAPRLAELGPLHAADRTHRAEVAAFQAEVARAFDELVEAQNQRAEIGRELTAAWASIEEKDALLVAAEQERAERDAQLDAARRALQRLQATPAVRLQDRVTRSALARLLHRRGRPQATGDGPA